MGFFSYIKYKRCFNWAYGSRAISPGECTTLLENEARRAVLTIDGELFCIKPE